MIVRKIEAKKQKQTLCRVSAYCRVSTDNHDQLESLETQKEHYESCIRAHPTHVMAYRLCFRIAEMVKSTIFLPNQSADFPETQQIVCQLSEN